MTSKLLRLGGIAAAIVLVAFGVAAVVAGVAGRSTVRDAVSAERIVGTPDMTPALTRTAVQEAGLKNVTIPTCSVAGKTVSNGGEAKCFAEYMRIHALEATGGQVYADMGRFLDASGKPTSDEAAAAKDPKSGRPVENGMRALWVTETALATALQTSFFAENVALFSIAVGIALLLIGIGLGIVALGLLRRPEAAPAARTAAPVGRGAAPTPA